MGAYDFLTKPSDPQHLCLLVETPLPRERTLQDELAALLRPDRRATRVLNILSKCPRMFESSS